MLTPRVPFVSRQSIEREVLELEKKQAHIKGKIEELTKNSFAIMSRVLKVWAAAGTQPASAGLGQSG